MKNSISRQMSDTFINAIFLTLSGGLQDAYTYVCRGKVFANAQTGNIVLMSKYLFERNLPYAMRYLAPICAFIAGTFIAEIIHRHFKNAKIIHWRQLILIIEIILLFLSGFIPHRYDMIVNIIISFVCAMQVQSFRVMDGLAYASTMCIGNMRYATEALCTFLHTRNKKDFSIAFRYFAVIFLFALGAGIGCILTEKIGITAIWLSCLLLSVSFIVMLIQKNASKK